MPIALGQTITVVNKSGKVVSTSKHLVSVFKEAKSAYRERKAEIKAVRNAEYEEKKARKALKALEVNDDTHSRTSSKASKTTSRSRSRREKPPVERGYSDSFYANDGSRVQRPSRLRHELDVDRETGRTQRLELTRRHTEGDAPLTPSYRTTRSHSEPGIDMDLAYGELPPPLPVKRYEEETELREKMSALTMLLDEANCVQYSVTAIIENLQKNPEALAAVALTLAEISNLAGKMAPGVLAAMKGSFPAVIALLASPQFMIAAGVGVGVTIVALGGYKIIKRIKEKRDGELEEPMRGEELQEIDTDVSRIELWRRGIADIEAHSAGTSVDGEFITPHASRQLIDEGVLREDDLKSTKSKSKSKSRSKDPKPAKSSKSSKSTKEEKKPKKKELSGLKMLFQHHSHSH
ncbi:hypothetical protein H2199_005989 [Coniosporium tulheliwenetii]|uniref:Uncharacterized protein n=1 Tax=Coniosporium tulheliwenetii TaxID=3383036 RepID=A0ACC2YYW0_9PEZI|nr:hypothetical protein H2199_005989 [Cladosporium sp. JES 115]